MSGIDARAPGFRTAMGELHTWVGVILGGVLLAMFWMGTLSVFDREIDRWMLPATRLVPSAVVADTSPLDRVAAAAQPLVPGDATQWSLTLPTARVPVYRFGVTRANGESSTRWLDPQSGALLPDEGSHAGTGFIFPFHFMLHLKWQRLGYWIAGLAAMAMLALLVSGVVIHRKLFADFFLFRPRKAFQRSTLDLHNLTGVLGLPFHLLMTLSGLVIFINIYFPMAPDLAYRDEGEARVRYEAESFGRYARAALGEPFHGDRARASIDAMIASAERRWQGGRAYFVRVWHPGDAASYVEVRRSFAHDVTMHLDTVYFDASSGELLKAFQATPVMNVQRFLSGLHFVQFEHWGLRWLYFVLGLGGCAMIATGLLFWVEARRARHARHGHAGAWTVEAMTVGSVTGLVLATTALFLANRLLPLDAHGFGMGRAALEMTAFYLVWLASFGHALWRRRRAWCEQAIAVALLALVAVVANALGTRGGLADVGAAHPAVLGVDLGLVVAAGIAAALAHRLRALR